MSDLPYAGEFRRGLAVFALAFAAYAATLFPGVAGGDSGELTAAAVAMGIPHPTGYPLYMAVARLWLWAYPVGEAAFRLNVLSALCAAAAAAALYRLHRDLGRGVALSGALALLFAYAPAVWSQGIAAEVYAFEMLLASLFLLAILRWCRGKGDAWLLAASLLAGAQLAHHLTSVFVIGAGGLAVLGRRLDVPWKSLGWRAALLALLPLTLYGYLVVRSLADPPVDAGDPETLAALWRHVTGGRYQGKLLPVRWIDVAANARSLGRILGDAFPLLLSVPALAGVGFALLRARPFGVAIAALALAQGAFCLLYRVADLEAFTLPLILALTLGLGETVARVAALPRLSGARLPRGAAAGLLAAGLGGLGLVNAARMDPGPAFFASLYASDLLDSLPYGAQVVAEGDFATHALLHAQVVEQRRTDVTVITGDPGLFQGYGNLNAAARGLYVTSPELLAPAGAGRPREHGALYVASPPKAGAPDPGEVYRPLPDDGELRRQGRRDAMAQAALVDRLKRRWERARAAGDTAAAARSAEHLLAESDRYLGMIVPREDEFRAMVKTATQLGRPDLMVLWTERLAAVSALEDRLANNLAWAHLQTGGDLGRAERLARAAVAARPDDAEYLDTLAAVLAAAGKHQEAADVLRRSRAAASPPPPGGRPE